MTGFESLLSGFLDGAIFSPIPYHSLTDITIVMIIYTAGPRNRTAWLLGQEVFQTRLLVRVIFSKKKKGGS
jgi:hypothetical protein